jgi:outer membrane lipoprotein SlyB
MNNNTNKSSLHPMVLAAAAAVILVSGVGVAAMMGWLPSSESKTPDAANVTPIVAQPAATATPPIADAVPAPVAAPVAAPVVAPAREVVREPVRQPMREPVREAVKEKPPVVKHTPVKSEPAVCNSCGVIESISSVDQRAEGSGVGAVGGALLGGLLGHQVGDGNGRKLATVAGAIGGAVAGNQVEGRVKATRTYTIAVRLENGKVQNSIQNEQPNWREGDRVRIVNGNLRADD